MDPTLQDLPQVGGRTSDRGNVRRSFLWSDGWSDVRRRRKRDVKTSFQGCPTFNVIFQTIMSIREQHFMQTFRYVTPQPGLFPLPTRKRVTVSQQGRVSLEYYSMFVLSLLAASLSASLAIFDLSFEPKETINKPEAIADVDCKASCK